MAAWLNGLGSGLQPRVYRFNSDSRLMVDNDEWAEAERAFNVREAWKTRVKEPEVKEFPTVAGSVIGWSTYYDGPKFGSALLELAADNEPELVWYLAGFEKTLTTEELRELVGSRWEFLGTITPDTIKAVEDSST